MALAAMPALSLHGPSSRPTADELAHELLTDAEFEALQLGTWLNTTNGKVISEAVEMVLPPFYRQDAELLVEALQLAANLRRGRAGAGREKLPSGHSVSPLS